MRLRLVFCAFALGLATALGACESNSTDAPSGGGGGVPNKPNSSSSSGGDTDDDDDTTPTKKPDAGAKDSGGGSAGDDDDTSTFPPPGGPGNLRLMGANISSGDKQSYDPGEGARIFQGLKPDVVMIQEFNYGTGSDADIRQFVTNTFDATYSYYRESGAALHIPNGVISRFPILDSGRWEAQSADRGFVYAKIQVPGPKPLWAISVHLLTTSSANREAEAVDLVAKIQAMIPPDDYLAIGGDFNTDSRSEQCLTTFATLVDVTDSHAADNNGSENTNAPRNKPYDWVLVSPNLQTQQVSTVIGANTFTKGLVFDSNVYTPLADVAPVVKTDSHALNMQHMPIVKDFHLQ